MLTSISLRTLSLSSNPCPGTNIHTSEGMLSITPVTRLWRVFSFCATGEGDSTIDILTDNVLLEIFCFYQAFYLSDPDVFEMPLRDWRQLMHVCRRWRHIIFESPRRLNLQILCTFNKRFKKSLGIWPDFPIAIKHRDFRLDSIGQDDVIAALEHPDRVFCIELNITSSQLEKMTTLLQKSFPVLTHLDICSKDDESLDLPGGFLGGSAPCLQKINLSVTSFPALPTLLLSAKNLEELTLWGVPPTYYISPGAMVACLAELPRLDTLCLHFTLVAVRLGQIHPPPMTRVVLLALANFDFFGTSEYLEDLVAQIDCPELDHIHVYITNPVVNFQVAQLSKFLNRSVGLEMSPYSPTEVDLAHGRVVIKMFCDPNLRYYVWKPEGRRATIVICYQWTDLEVSLFAEVVNRFSAILSAVDHLSLMSSETVYYRIKSADDIDWPHLLHPFSAVQTLHVSSRLARHLAPVLEDIPAERVTEVLPSLWLAYLEGHPGSFLKKFVAARELSDRLVAVFYRQMEYTEILECCITLSQQEGVSH